MFCFIKAIFSSFSNFQPGYTEAASVQYLALFIGAYHGNCSDRALFVLDVQTSQASVSSCACSNPGKLLLCDFMFFFLKKNFMFFFLHPWLKQRGEGSMHLSHGWSFLLPSCSIGANACCLQKQKTKLLLLQPYILN